MAEDTQQDPQQEPEVATAAAVTQDDALQQKLATAEEQLLRTASDFQNFRRRAEEERAQSVSVARTDVVLDLLPVIDNFDRAFKEVPEEVTQSTWYQGVQAIRQQFHAVLEGLGIQRIESVGQPFDPELHEAISKEASDQPEDIIVEEFEAGYRLGEDVIRHARVKVSAGKE